MKHKLTLKPVNGGAFRCLPAREVELPSGRILCNDVRLPWEDGARLMVIGNEFGALCAVWSKSWDEAFDIACDADLLGGLVITESRAEEDEDTARLGNYGTPCDLTHAWIQEVELSGPRDWEIIARFAEARGNGSDTL